MRGPSSKLAALALVVLGAACGQYGGVHGRDASVELRESRVATQASPSPTGSIGADGAPLLASPNGENSGRVPTITYKRITVTTKVTAPEPAGPFSMCPVQGEGYYSDDFGAPRYAGGYHPHQGNDLFADFGTPVVAPFAGTAAATPNLLGGLAVKVYGNQGYVYNAHLIGYGKLGAVNAGDVIGHVGNTGDAMGGPPHDHFEWHPNNGPAIDPYPYLREVC